MPLNTLDKSNAASTQTRTDLHETDCSQLIAEHFPLESVIQFLEKRVRPAASQLDVQSDQLFEMFTAAGAQSLLTPKLPTDWGGSELSGNAYQQLQMLFATHSGALTFLLAQHQSAASFILASENEALKTEYLPAMTTGDKRIGVGFSHLRRQTPPAIARRTKDGYVLSGEIPWVTGSGLFSEFVGAAQLPSGEAIFGLLPLTNAAGITISQPMAMAGMAATSTVRVTLNNWVLSDEKVMGLRPAGWLGTRDRINPLSPMGMILGCAAGACRILSEALKRRTIALDLPERLHQIRMQLSHELTTVSTLPTQNYDQKIALRGRAIAHMNQCAQAAMVASGGAANALHHPARRIYGEALVFSVSGQTNDGAVSTLEAIHAISTGQ